MQGKTYQLSNNINLMKTSASHTPTPYYTRIGNTAKARSIYIELCKYIISRFHVTFFMIILIRWKGLASWWPWITNLVAKMIVSVLVCLRSAVLSCQTCWPWLATHCLVLRCVEKYLILSKISDIVKLSGPVLLHSCECVSICSSSTICYVRISSTKNTRVH